MIPPPSDPYAAFGGAAVQSPAPAATPPPAEDPYAAFGGSSAPPPPAAPPPSMLDETRQRVGHTPREFIQNVQQRLADLNEGIRRYSDEAFIPLEEKMKNLPVVGGAVGRQLEHDKSVVNAPLPEDRERKGSQELGADLTGLAEWYGGSELLKGLSFVQKYPFLR